MENKLREVEERKSREVEELRLEKQDILSKLDKEKEDLERQKEELETLIHKEKVELDKERKVLEREKLEEIEGIIKDKEMEIEELKEKAQHEIDELRDRLDETERWNETFITWVPKPFTTYEHQFASCPYCIKQIFVFVSLQGSGSLARKAFDLQFIHGE